MAGLIKQRGYYHIRVKFKGKAISQETTGIPIGTGPKEQRDCYKLALLKLDEYENRDNQVFTELDLKSYTAELLSNMESMYYQPGTIALYKLSIESYLKRSGNKVMSKITKDDIMHWINRIKPEISASTVAIRYKKLRAVFNHAIDDKKLKVNPCSGKLTEIIGRIDKVKTKFKIYTEPEIRKLLDTEIIPIKTAIIIASETGMRQKEIMNLEWSNINFKDNTIEVINKPTFKTKTGSHRTIPMSTKLRKYLKLIQGKGYVLGKLYSQRFFQQMFQKQQRLQGITGRTFHSLRHTFITQLLRAGYPVEKVMKFTGISDYKTIQIYTHIEVDDIRELVK
jgi:integrase/recombinase XerD